MQCAAKLLRVVGKRDKERSRAKKAVICGFIDTAPFAAVFCNKPLCLNVISQMLAGTANYDTLLYGIECKYYSARPETDDFEIKGCKDIYAMRPMMGAFPFLSIPLFFR